MQQNVAQLSQGQTEIQQGMKLQSEQMVMAMTHGFSLIAQQLTGNMAHPGQTSLENRPQVPMLELPQPPAFHFGITTARSGGSGSASSAASREELESARAKQREIDRQNREEEDKARKLAQELKEREEIARTQEEQERKRREHIAKQAEDNERRKREETSRTGTLETGLPRSRKPVEVEKERENSRSPYGTDKAKTHNPDNKETTKPEN